MNSSQLTSFNRWVWAILLLSLPITSSPLLARVIRGTSVAPLSLIPLLILVISLLLPSILKQKFLPKPVVPLALFVLLAIFSIALSGFIDIPSFRGLNPLKISMRDLLTLAVGICFYLTTIYANDDESSLRFSMHWLYIGGAALIVFAVFQFLVWRLLHFYPEFLMNFQGVLSTSGKLYEGRVTSFALEPSWLAHQLNVLYLPIWLALSVRGTSIYKTRLFKIFTIENGLLVGGLFTLTATLSRIGWLSVGGLLIYLLVCWANNSKRKLLRRHFRQSQRPKNNRPQLLAFELSFWLAIIIIIAFLGLGGAKILSLLDPKRMASVFAFFDFQYYGLLGWANRLEMAERLLYWMSAFYTFLAFPLLGVGLGNSGFFFLRNLPAFGYGSPEIMQQILFNSSLVNAKNLWARLLAETGVIGFACFVAWAYNQLRLSILLEKMDEKPLFRSMGLAGILITISFVIEGFSIDSFALPYYWIGLGLVMGTYGFVQKSAKITLIDH